MNEATRDALLKAAYLADRIDEFLSAIKETRQAWSKDGVNIDEWYDFYQELEVLKAFSSVFESVNLPAFKVASTIGHKLEEF